MRNRWRYLLIVILGGSGVLHLLFPRPYRSIVPDVLPLKDEIVLVSGLAELACAGLLAVPGWRRAGGWLSAALLVAVFPANVSAALAGGYRGLQPPFNSAAAAWLRLPLQLPLVLIALRVARQSKAGSS
jgi:uncharacterized membrane protein